MKLPELKKRFTRKYVIRIIAGVLVVGMVGTGVSTANVFAAKTAQESTESTESTEKDSEKDDSDAESKLKDALDDSIKFSRERDWQRRNGICSCRQHRKRAQSDRFRSSDQ